MAVHHSNQSQPRGLKAPQGRRNGSSLPAEPGGLVQARLSQNGGRGKPGLGAGAFEIFDGIGHGSEGDALMQSQSSAFMPVTPGDASLRQCAPMNTAQTIREWLRTTLDSRPGLTVASWAKSAKVAPSTIHRALKPDYQFVTSSSTLSKLAQAADVPALDATADPQIVGAEFLPIRYDVGAGLWQEMTDAQVFVGTGTVAPDPAYSGFPQWLERVQGDSMDREYRPGDLVHVVDAVALGYAPQHGDHVILVRRRQDGGEIERTIKEVTRTPRGIEFWPRSDNPRWNKPVILAADPSDDSTEVEVAALVIGSYRPRR